VGRAGAAIQQGRCLRRVHSSQRLPPDAARSNMAGWWSQPAIFTPDLPLWSKQQRCHRRDWSPEALERRYGGELFHVGSDVGTKEPRLMRLAEFLRECRGSTLNPRPGTRNPHLVKPDFGLGFQGSGFMVQGDDFRPLTPEPPDTCANIAVQQMLKIHPDP